MKLKKWITAVGTLALIATMTAPTFAATYSFQTANVTVNGATALSHAVKFVANNTTYMSVYDVQLVINKLIGTTNKSGDVWDGAKGVWNITDSKATAKVINGSYGNVKFEINNSVVMKAPTIVTKELGSKQATTFAPIWYVQQVINELLKTSSNNDIWNGSKVPSEWKIVTEGSSVQSSQSGTQPQWKQHNGGNGQKGNGETSSTPTTSGVIGFNQ